MNKKFQSIQNSGDSNHTYKRERNMIRMNGISKGGTKGHLGWKGMVLLVVLGVTSLGSVSVYAPALPAGSFIDVGFTVRQGNIIKGSGSFTNTGDLRKVCVQIRSIWNRRYIRSRSEACRDVSYSSGYAFSAPDIYAGPCRIDRHTLLHGGLCLEEVAILAQHDEEVELRLLSHEFLGRGRLGRPW